MKSSDVRGMLTQSCGAMGVELMKRKNDQGMAGMGCSDRKQFGKPMVINYYSGTPMFTNLYEDTDVERRYNEGVMSVSVKEFRLMP